ncbi:TIGR02300 family protein [Sphingomonas sp. GCM10030256]|uniref:TIGR02300 family protein n=1 Tax=Sphingomonas sp. GCM10030256 TaxID=3273427 RepID=UPI00360A506D
MVKPEWGAKRTCPKCSARFYDLGNDQPVTCIECGSQWVPEPVLKSKQPMPFETAAAAGVAGASEKAADADLGAEDLAVDEDEEPSADDEVDIGTGDDDLGVEAPGDDEEH